MNREEDPNAIELLTEAANGMAQFLIEALSDKEVIGEIIEGGSKITKLTKICYNHHLQKTTEAFYSELKVDTIPKEQLEKYKKKLIDDPEYAEAEFERISYFLAMTYETEKSKILARAYASHINERIEKEDFEELTEVLDRSFLPDLKLLAKINNCDVMETGQCEAHRADRLSSLGLITLHIKPMTLYPGSVEPESSNIIKITSLGKMLVSFL